MKNFCFLSSTLLIISYLVGVSMGDKPEEDPGKPQTKKPEDEESKPNPEIKMGDENEEDDEKQEEKLKGCN